MMAKEQVGMLIGIVYMRKLKRNLKGNLKRCLRESYPRTPYRLCWLAQLMVPLLYSCVAKNPSLIDNFTGSGHYIVPVSRTSDHSVAHSISIIIIRKCFAVVHMKHISSW